MAAQAGCSSWRLDNDPDQGGNVVEEEEEEDVDNEEEEDEETTTEPEAGVDMADELEEEEGRERVREGEEVNVSNSSLMPPPTHTHLAHPSSPPAPPFASAIATTTTTTTTSAAAPSASTACYQSFALSSSSGGQPSSSVGARSGSVAQQAVTLKGEENQGHFTRRCVSPSGGGHQWESRVPWHRTPEVVMVKVLSYLNDADRCSVCRTCHAWRRSFRHPYLWKTRHFYFGGFGALEKQDSYSRFLAQVGCHVQNATVELGRPNINTATVIARAFEAFVYSVTKCPGLQLLSVTVVSADFLSGWHFFSHNRGKVIRSLCSLLKKQSCLRSADLSYCLMDRDEGSRLLEALNHGTRLRPKLNLARLDLRQFFSPGARLTSCARYVKVMGQFAHLVSLRMDLRNLNEPILQGLTTSSVKTLRRLELDFYADESVGNQAIGSSCWREVVDRCHDLAVVVRIHGLCGFAKYTSVLVKGLPLHELRLTYLGVEDLSNPDLARSVDTLIVYLADAFHRTLTKLYVHVRPDMELAADTAVVGLVRRCLQLSELNVTFAVQASTFVLILETIHRHRNAALRGAKKTRLRLNIRGMTPELDQTIRHLTSGAFSDVSGKATPRVPDLT